MRPYSGLRLVAFVGALTLTACGGELRAQEWYSVIEPDSIRGHPHTWAAVTVDEEARLLQPTLMVVCKGDVLVVGYSPNDAIRMELSDGPFKFFLERPAELAIRFDSDQISLESWAPSDDALMFLSPQPIQFVRRFEAASSGVEIGVPGRADQLPTDTFMIRGFQKAASVLHCMH